MAVAPSTWVAVPAMLAAGMAWITVANSLSVSAQMSLPNWVRARGMASYQMAIMGASALGAALWGQVATVGSLQTALLSASASGVLVMLLAIRFVTDSADEESDMSPARAGWAVQPVAEPREEGHMVTTIEYLIDPARDGNGVPKFGRRIESVYQPWILLRTWAALRYAPHIQLPNDVENLIETVYDSERETSGNVPFIGAMQDAKLAMDRDLQEAEQEARNRFLPLPRADGPLGQFTANPLEEDSPDIHQRLRAVTRLGDDGIQVICLFGDPACPTLDASGSRPIDLSRRPAPNVVKALLYRSLTITNRRLVSALALSEPPPAWAKNALLRYHRVLFFGQDSKTTVNGFTVDLDPELGFRVMGKEGT